jgi:hypothetical protein
MQDKKKSGSKSSTQNKKTQKKTSKPRSKSGRSSPSKSFQQRDPSRLKEPKMTTRGATGSLVGEDLVATLGSSSTEIKAGDVLLDVQLNPELMALPRLTSLSKLFKRWRIKSMTFEYRPTATIQPGQLLGYIDYDPYTDASAGTNLQRLQRATASYGEKPVNITNTKTWSVMKMPVALQIHSDNVTTPTNWYVFGRFVIYANSNIAANVDCGNIVCKYDIEFLYPSYEAPSSVSNGVAPPGFFFEGDWNATTQTYDNQMFFTSSNDLKSKVSISGPEIKVTNLTCDANPYLNTYFGFITMTAQSSAYYGVGEEIKGWTEVFRPKRGEYNSADSRGNLFLIAELSDSVNSLRMYPSKYDVGTFQVRVVFGRCADFNFVGPCLPKELKETKQSPSEQKSTDEQALQRVPLYRSGTSAPPTTPNGSGSSSTLSSATVSSGWFRV